MSILKLVKYNFITITMKIKDIIAYYFCCCFYSDPINKEDNYIAYNDIYKDNNYDTYILDYTTSI